MQGVGHVGTRWPLSAILQRGGLDTNLELCLDAGDIASAPPSPTKWLDTSGNGYDFFLGTDATSQSSDPTFNGTPGGRSRGEYWSFDGGDYFTIDQINPTWVDNLHKDGAQYTILAWCWMPELAGAYTICGTASSTSTEIGIRFRYDSSGSDRLRIEAFAGTGTDAMDAHSGSEVSAPTLDKWQLVGISHDEPGAKLLWVMDNEVGQEGGSDTYASPPASDASDPFQIAANGDGSERLPNNARMAMFAAWSRALTAAELARVYQMTRPRFIGLT